MILSYFNKTYAIETGSWKYWHMFFVIEIIIIIISYKYFIPFNLTQNLRILFINVCLYANEKTRKFHLNLRVPVFWFYFQYDFQGAAWIYQRYLILISDPIG